MAVIKRGILGGFQNKIGNVVGSSWKGISTMRSLPISVANPRTAAQVNQRNKFTAAVQMAKQLLPTIVKPLWDRFAQGESGYNAFIRRNLPAFTSGGGFSQNLLVISEGPIATSPITSMSWDAATERLTVNWNPTPPGDSLPDDQAFIVVNVSGVPGMYGFSTGVNRSAGTATIQVPFNYIAPAYTTAWLAFRRADGTKVSNSTRGNTGVL